jgi:DinB superfamily
MNGWDKAESELNAAADQAQRLIDSTPARLFTVRPMPTNWSAAECIAHLSISSQMFLPIFRSAFDAARSAKGTAAGIPRMDLLGRILRWFLEPPVRTRTKTPPAFVPKSTRAKSEALAEFASFQRQLIGLLAEARTLPVQNVKIVSPFNTRIRYSVYSAFLIITAHQRRHLWQAEQAVSSLRRSSAAA